MYPGNRTFYINQQCFTFYCGCAKFSGILTSNNWGIQSFIYIFTQSAFKENDVTNFINSELFLLDFFVIYSLDFDNFRFF